MKNELHLNRRHFIQGLGATAVGTGVRSVFASSAVRSKSEISFLYVGTALDTIEVIDVRSSRWGLVERVKSAAPASLVLAANGKTLYAANRIATYRGLPMGTVEAYSVGADGRLSLSHRQELSLAATMPRHLALASDGRSLIVTTKSGVYNVLPIDQAGLPGRASSIVKVTGRNNMELPAPRLSGFDRAGRVLSVDAGTNRLRIFSAAVDGTMAQSHFDFGDARSPKNLTVHPSLDALYVRHETGMTCYGYDHEKGQITGLRQQVDGIELNDGTQTLAIHPSGNLLIGCDRHAGLVTWSISGSVGALKDRRKSFPELGKLSGVEIIHGGTDLVTMNQERGQIAVVSVDQRSGHLGNRRILGEIDSPQCLAFV